MAKILKNSVKKISNKNVCILDVVFHQIEIILKDSTAFVYVTYSV